MPTAKAAPIEEDLIETSVDAIAGASPLSFLDGRQSAAAAGRLARRAVVQSPKVVRSRAKLAADLVRIGVGKSPVSLGADKRFADEVWAKNPLYRRLGQSYLAWNQSVHDLIDDLDLDAKSALRSHFIASLLTEAVAPTNSLLGNPAALREAVRTKGGSLRSGLRHWVHDQRHNGGMPSVVDTRPYKVGETIAATPGAVVFRNDVLELLRYSPTTPKVYERPLLFVPPQINRYYVLDLAPGRSVVEAAVAAGQQVFMVSWRNPTPDQRDWNLETYCGAILEAIGVVTELTGQSDLNLVGVCAGGITSAALLGYMAAVGDNRVHAVTFLVTVLDWEVPSTVGTFTSGPSVAAAIQRSQNKGVLAGADLARLFAWLRPNDLVWNYWVNNYLMGKNPPAFDILAWNADATNLPAGLHADFLSVASRNGLAKANEVVLFGEKVDLGAVTCENYVIAGLTDHITPWEGCYGSVDLLGGPSTFVLCASGHIQTLVCPTDNPKAKYLTGELPEGGGVEGSESSARAWQETATPHVGSWWGHWLGWLETRSGSEVAAPKRLGNRRYPAREAAPGSYVIG